MKITVCELRNKMDIFEEEWQKLVSHVKTEGSDLVLLPEMPFCSWIAHTNLIDVDVWRASIEQHDRWISRLSELTPAVVVSSRPVIKVRIPPHSDHPFRWKLSTHSAAL